MISQLKNWKGAIEIDGTLYNSIEELSNFDFKTLSNDSVIKLSMNAENLKYEQAGASGERVMNTVNSKDEVIIKVKPYMTKKATTEFDFMRQWNEDNPMPLVIMKGYKNRETKGMVHMTLHGDIMQRISPCCMKCGKPIDNPVSQFFGMGPICGGHNYVNPFDSEEELNDAVSKYRKEVLQNIKWEGWIIKSAIISEVKA